jgi:hypothetical protein
VAEELAISRSIAATSKKMFRILASLKVAIPLLVLTVVVTIVVSLFPQTELFRSWWYLSLLGLNGLSLLLVTILHIPSILKKKGRNALIGVVATHLGILILIAGAVYGGVSGFRHQVRLIEGEVTIIPGLPFVILLDELVIEEYDPDVFRHLSLEAMPKKKQESRISLLKGGDPWRDIVAAPGLPANVGGITLLPSVGETGWVFELIVISPQGREKTIPVRPWVPPVITIGSKQVMTHRVAKGGGEKAEIFTIENEQVISLGFAGRDTPLERSKATRCRWVWLNATRVCQYTIGHMLLCWFWAAS